MIWRLAYLHLTLQLAGWETRITWMVLLIIIHFCSRRGFSFVSSDCAVKFKNQIVWCRGEAVINLCFKCSLQNSFLFYFNLKSVNSEDVPRAISPLKKSGCRRRYPMGVRFSRCSAVPFSSPLGILIQKKSRMAPINSQVSPMIHFYYFITM
jgi:hypothetical protein